MKGASVARKATEANVKILVASDNSSDASLIKKLLSSEYDHISISTDPALVAQNFDSSEPDVLVLAFDTIEKSEQYYLGLFRLGGKVHLQPHRTVMLCHQKEVDRAYKACKNGHFDDYILFWPMTHDAPRLLMSVHHALRDLASARDNVPSGAQFAAHARPLSEMGNLLDRKMAQGSQHIDLANQAIVRAEQEIGAALDGFSSTLGRGGSGTEDPVQNLFRLEQEIKRIKRDMVGPSFRSAIDAVQPMRNWVNQFKKEYAPHIESALALNAMADCIPAIVMVVDDDELQRRIVGEMLSGENYRLVFAAGGLEALNILRKVQPDLILMDILMQDLDGIETTRRLKSMPQFVNLPVIMASGSSAGTLVRDSMKAGAVDFVVKPYDRESILPKVARALHR